MSRVAPALLALAIVALAQAGLVAQETEGGMSRSQMQQMYVDYLKVQGYVPEVDQDGDVTFRYQGSFYYIEVNENDPEFFRLVHPRFYVVEGTDQHQRALLAVDHANRATKNTKILKIDEAIAGVAESFVGEPRDFEKIFARSISALQYGVDQFETKMRELALANLLSDNQ